MSTRGIRLSQSVFCEMTVFSTKNLTQEPTTICITFLNPSIC